jgi:hypothetical protein
MFLEKIIEITMNNPLIYGTALTIALGITRSIAGYIENCLKEDADKFSLYKLGETIVRMLPQTIGLEAIVPGAGAASLVTDYIVKAAKK